MRSNCTYIALSLLLSSPFVSANTLVPSKNNFEFRFLEGNTADFEIDSGYGYIDNFLHRSEQEQSTTVAMLGASAFLQSHNDSHLFQAYGDVEALKFDKFSEDDHSVFDVKAKYFYKFTDLQTVFASASLSDRFEYRGTGISKGNGENLEAGDEYDDTLFNIGYRYGRFDSVSKVSVLVGVKEREYQTRKAITSSLNYDTNFAHVGLDYLVSGKTYFSINAEYDDIDYADSVAQDQEQLTVLAGIKWEPSQLSKLTLLVGYQSLNFQDNVFEDEDSFRWRVFYDWTPVEYLKLNLRTSRVNQNSNELETNYRVVDDYSVSASYGINSYINASLAMEYIDEQITFASTTIGESYIKLSSKIDYKFNDRIGMSLSYIFNTVDSDIDINEYDKSQILLGLTAKF